MPEVSRDTHIRYILVIKTRALNIGNNELRLYGSYILCLFVSQTVLEIR